MKMLFKIILAIGFIGWVSQMISNGCNGGLDFDVKPTKTQTQTQTNLVASPTNNPVSEVSTEKKMADIKNKLIEDVRELQTNIFNYKSSDYLGTAKLNVSGAEQLNNFRVALIDYEASSTWSTAIPDALKAAKSKLIKLKVSELPKLREDYGKNTGESLWDRDIYIKVIGKNKDIIEFTGGIYAANRSKKQTQESLYDDFMILGFKKVIYKWYKGQDDYSYYTMNSNPDNYFE